MEDIEKEKRKGEFQHKIFKFIILIIVGLFFCLIIGFVYVEFFGAKNEQQYVNFLYQINNERYEQLKNIDVEFFKKYDNKVPVCNVSRIYANHITKSLPCYIDINNADEQYKIYYQHVKQLNDKNNLTSNTAGLIYFLNKYLDFIQLNIFTKEKPFKKQTFVDNKMKFYIQIDGSCDYYLAPISIINELKVFKDLKGNDSNKLCSNIKLSQIKNKDLLLKVHLNQGNLLFVPNYFFIDLNCDVNDRRNNIALFEYNGIPRQLNNIFDALFFDKEMESIDADY